jgi:hypothetical protein
LVREIYLAAGENDATITLSIALAGMHTAAGKIHLKPYGLREYTTESHDAPQSNLGVSISTKPLNAESNALALLKELYMVFGIDVGKIPYTEPDGSGINKEAIKKAGGSS